MAVTASDFGRFLSERSVLYCEFSTLSITWGQKYFLTYISVCKLCHALTYIPLASVMQISFFAYVLKHEDL